ncbi:MAG: DUF58 domain-containing protein [Lachnospiraceae bacterium]|nr:DUF58 domain-containing protein [Lachnospiraceae bacterium]
MTIILLILAVVLITLEIRSVKVPPDKLDYEVKVSSNTVEQGEEFTITSVYTNRTGQKLPFICSEEYISPHIEIEGLKNKKAEIYSGYDEDAIDHKKTYSIYMKKNERITHSEKAKCYKRGIFLLSSCVLTIGDYLGLKTKISRRTTNCWVAVRPRRLQDARLDSLFKGILGDISVKSFIFEDPMLVRGFRDYSGSEPFRSISFAQSAKAGNLIVKEFDHTRETTVDIIFDADFKGCIDGFFDRIETCFALTRTLTENLANRKINFRFITNLCYSSYTDADITVIEGDYHKLLEFLTGASRATSCKYREFIDYLETHLTSADASIVYITQDSNEETEIALHELQSKYNINTHVLSGRDFEEIYHDSKIL